jgi:hypothetical protein
MDKKVTNTTKDTKKKVVKKNSSKVIKKTPSNTKKSFKKENIFTQDNILKFIFYFLIVLVIVLFILVLRKESTKDSDVTANIVVPIYAEDTHNTVSVNLKALANLADKEYILKVTNYKNSTINTKEISYTITVLNDTDSTIEVYKDNGTRNLMSDEESSLVDANKLKIGEKQEVYYHIKLVKAGTLEDTTKIDINIAS